MDKRKPGYYAVIPAHIRYDESLRPNAKLLYGELTALAGPDGYCWATNQYFADLYGLAVSTVSELIKSLSERGYIKIEMSSNSKGAERHIYAGSFMVFTMGEGSSEKPEDPPGEGLPKNRKRGLPKNRKDINDNNINIINTPLPPALKGVKFLSEPLLKRLAEYAGRDEQLLTALLAHAEMRYKLKRPIVTDRTLTLLLNNLEKLAGNNRSLKLAIIDKAIEHNWQTFYALKPDDIPSAAAGQARTVPPKGVEEW